MSSKVEFGFVASPAGAPGASDSEFYRGLLDDCERNQALGSRQADLSAQRYGPLRPGFTTVLDVAFETGQAQVRSLSCDAHARGLPHRVD